MVHALVQFVPSSSLAIQAKLQAQAVPRIPVLP